MPRKKLVRRFDPRFGGVSQSMLDAEATYVARELEDHLLYSITDVRKCLDAVQTRMAASESNLQAILDRLPDRERLALKYMLAADICHIAMLYETFLRSSNIVGEATGPHTPAPEEVAGDNETRSVLVFRQSLFE
jgi:hypothetical protein